MTPEQKFKDWALDPNGGGWKYTPDERDHNWEWRQERSAFLAGMEADRWISVEERLPERPKTANIFSVNVQVWDNDWPREGYYNFDTKSWIIINDREYYTSTDVTHWQPLPKPPKP